ncbi:MAG: hypothetical protein ACT4QG_19420 [Sporichthyaceae bacterium]
MRRIVGISVSALIAVPLLVGGAGVASAAPAHVAGGSPEIGGEEGPLGVAGFDDDAKKSKKSKKERREGSRGVAGIEPGDNPIEEGQGSIPDTNGFSTEDGPLGEDGPLSMEDGGPIDTNGIGSDDDRRKRHYDNRTKKDDGNFPFDRPAR